MDKDNLLKHFDVLQFMDTNKLNNLLLSKSAGSQNDFKKEHRWMKINDTNLYALVYENNGKKYINKVYKGDDNIDEMGLNSVDAYGGIKKKGRPKTIKSTSETKTKSIKNKKDYTEDLTGKLTKE